MPLITQSFPVVGCEDNVEASKTDDSHDTTRTPLKNPRDFADFEELDDSDMEGSILHRPRPKKVVKAPTLPQRNERRTSKMLDTLTIELKGLEAAHNEGAQDVSDPHELYLSSEEDASESADDYEGSLLSCEDVDEKRSTSSRASSRASQQDTAKLVLLKFVGKPQVVEICIHSQSRKPSPEPVVRQSQSSLSLRRPSPPPHYPTSNYRLSISSSSNSSVLSNSASTTPLPPRKSSKTSEVASNAPKPFQPSCTSYIPPSQPSFLTSDPCPTPPPDNESKPSLLRPFLQRTLSAARKRPSMPKMNLAYTTGVVAPRRSSLSSAHTFREMEKGHTRTPTLEELRLEEKASMEKEEQEGNFRYDDIKMGPSRVQTSPPSPMTPKYRASTIFGNLVRKKSMKIR
ncbi:hypothetical protein PVAG01_04667 [Phlyctema vagabunda]|uniref:Uncharacterized protein n=1 Tax=Phlyctema vagabunda TaxID=108571 RepID=A0ABR4PI02_9HELO